MGFIHTKVLIQTLKERLESLPLDPAQQTSPANRMFERVGVFGANQLEAAMKATFAAEQRVAFIVPVGDEHQGERSRLVLTSERYTSLVVLLADRALDKASAAALVGGPHALGILEMKDRVIDNLADVPFDAVDLCFAPRKGEPLMIQDTSNPGAGNLGRECWAQEFHTYAGLIHQTIP